MTGIPAARANAIAAPRLADASRNAVKSASPSGCAKSARTSTSTSASPRLMPGSFPFGAVGNRIWVRRANAAAAWICWWVGCFWLWMLHVGEWDRIDAVAGAAVAVVAASLAEAARRAVRVRPRVSLAVFRKSATVPVIVLADFAILTYALAASLARRRLV